MKSFDKYTRDWFKKFILDHEETEGYDMNLFHAMGFKTEILGEDTSYVDYLLTLDGKTIYKRLFMGATPISVEDLPSVPDFLDGMFQLDEEDKDYEFIEEFTENMADEASKYESPYEFFEDLQGHGCSSGMIGLLVWNEDCKKLYIKYMDDMDDFIADIEDQIGWSIIKCHPRYVYVCWTCYEEIAYRIARQLYPDQF
jgi:hypothetical protein